MNAVFCIMIAAAFGYAAIGGNLDAVTHAAVQAGGDALQTVLGLLGGFMLFGGVMKLLEEAGAVRALVRWLKRPLRWVFGSQAGEDALGATALNLSANMLGMGNAATPMGLRAARLLQPAGQIAASAPLCMLLVINATSVQLYPSSVIAMRYAAAAPRRKPSSCLRLLPARRPRRWAWQCAGCAKGSAANDGLAAGDCHGDCADSPC